MMLLALLSVTLYLSVSASVHSSSRDLLKDHPLSDYLRYVEPVKFSRSELRDKHARVRRSSGDAEIRITFRSHGRSFNVVATSNAKVFSDDFKLVVHSNGKHRVSYVDRAMFYNGYIEDEPGSNVIMYVQDGLMEATIYLKNETYYVENANSHFPRSDFSHIVYKSSDLIYNFTAGQQFEGSLYEELEKKKVEIFGVPESDENDPTSSNDGKKKYRRALNTVLYNTCNLALVSDHLYFGGPRGQSDIATTTAAMVYSTMQVTYVYTTTEFTNVGYGIQFNVAQITIYTSSSDTSNPYRAIAVSTAGAFLDTLSLGDPIHGDSWDHVCLAHAFTHRTFDNGIIGLAWVGDNGQSGICGKTTTSAGVKKSANTGISTTQNFGSTLPVIVGVITQAHEIGHNFGSSHDLAGQSANGFSCAPSGVYGNFIMYTFATDGTTPNNDVFSECSKNSIGAILVSKANRCFKSSATPICGNTIVEAGEQCDCGINSASPSAAEIAACLASDPCCNTAGCTVKSGKQCSPKAGTCCDDTCMFMGVSMAGNIISAVPSDKMGTVAAGGYLCSMSEDCLKPRYCVANALFKGACPPADWINDASNLTLSIAINENSPVPPCDNNNHASACLEFHRPKNTTCNGASALCDYNGCTKSLCSLYKPTDVSGQLPSAAFLSNATASMATVQQCFVSSADTSDTHLQCSVACAFQTGVCVSTYQYALTDHGMNMSVVGAARATGRSCDNYQGYCNANGLCTRVVADNPFNAFGSFNFANWAQTYWPVIAGCAGGFAIALFFMHYTYKKRKTAIDAVFQKLGAQIAKTLRRGRKDVPAAQKQATIQRGNQDKYRKLKQNDGLRRLRKFFPTVRSNGILQEVMATSKGEEEAVIKLLKLGYPLAAVPV